jgi:hypothetical protein
VPPGSGSGASPAAASQISCGRPASHSGWMSPPPFAWSQMACGRPWSQSAWIGFSLPPPLPLFWHFLSCFLAFASAFFAFFACFLACATFLFAAFFYLAESAFLACFLAFLTFWFACFTCFLALATWAFCLAQLPAFAALLA